MCLLPSAEVHRKDLKHLVYWLVFCVTAASMDLSSKVVVGPGNKIAFQLKAIKEIGSIHRKAEEIDKKIK